MSLEKKEALYEYLKGRKDFQYDTLEGSKTYPMDRIEQCEYTPSDLADIIDEPREACFEYKPTGKIYKKRFYVLTDEEADEVTEQNISETLWTFNDWFLAPYLDINKYIIRRVQKETSEDCNTLFYKILDCEGKFKDFVDKAVSVDGRGTYITGYDGIEREISHKDKDFFIYRMD